LHHFPRRSAGVERRFRNPLDIVEAWDEANFASALARLEQARSDGKWLAGYFSYEAGYLLEPKLQPLLPKGRRTPLLRFGIFDAPTDIP
jgi:para-aminobenzoate synthetase component 1